MRKNEINLNLNLYLSHFFMIYTQINKKYIF